MLAFYRSLLDTEEGRGKFAFIDRQYKGLMYHVALSAVKEHFLAEDVIHETFLNLTRIRDEVRISDPKETMNPQTVKARLHWARKMLLVQLEGESNGNKQE